MTASGEIRRVGVVVPARNEQDLLPRCLDGIHEAVERLREARNIATTTMVVLDSCTDDSAAVASRYADVIVRSVDWGNVGMTRATGCREVLGRHEPANPSTLWLASTDADSLVPPQWLTRQVELAEEGADLVLGTVTVDDWTDHPAHVAQRWAATYQTGDGHPHVHGANVGCRASDYLAAGGFPGLSCDEDIGLVAAMADREIVRVGDIAVTTSARLQSRATGGFATFLADLR